MKTKNLYKISPALIALVFLALTGCHKTNDTKSTGVLDLHMHTYIGNNEVENAGEFYPDANGRPLALSYAQFYITNVQVKNKAGEWISVSGSPILKRIEGDVYIAGNVAADDYTDIRFDVGVDATNNGTAPSSHSTTGSDSVLSTNENFMWFGSTTQGYIFMNLKGQVDISSAHDGSQLVDFDYKIGGNSNLKTITLPEQDFTVAPKQTATVHLLADYGQLLQDVNMTVSANRTADTYTTNTALAATIASNISNIYRYED